MKVALVCDWLTNVGGAEKVLLELHKLYPEAPIYTSKYDPKGIDWFKKADVRTGWLQIFPSKMRRVLGPLRQMYFSRLNLSEYDLIISVTGAEAKAVKSGKWLHEKGKKSLNPNGIHISYCHVPTQYYWQMYDNYIKNPGFGVLNPFVRFFFRLFVRPLRTADFRAAQRPEYFVTISEYAKDAIKRYYGREAKVIHPPVEIEDFILSNKPMKSQEMQAGKGSNNSGISQGSKIVKLDNDSEISQDKNYPQLVENFNITRAYITTSRQVNWKRIDLAVKACLMTQRHLLVVGEGPEHKKLVKMVAGSNLVQFLPLQKKKDLAILLKGARGYLFPSLEPFGIAPVEALAAGCPVIAYGQGGALDYIRDGKNGILFPEQSTKSLAEAILRFEKRKFNAKKVSESVRGYSVARFDKEVRDFINGKTK